MVKRILVVDDEQDVCYVLEKILGQNGFVVDSYEDPLVELEKFNTDLYDLAVLYVKMPDLNRSYLYREIKRLVEKIKICFLTAGEMYDGVHSDSFIR